MQMPLCLRSTFKIKYLLTLNWWHDCEKGSITVKTFFKTHYNVKHLPVMGLSLYPHCPDKGKAGNHCVALWDGFIPAPRAPGQAAVGSASPRNPGHFENLAFFLLMIQILANARSVLPLKMWWGLPLCLTNRSLEMFNKQEKGKREEENKKWIAGIVPTQNLILFNPM